MDLKPNEGMVMVARYDGRPPRVLTWKEKQVVFYVDAKGIPIYITEKEHAKALCLQKPDRYRLYRSVALTAQVTTAKGAIQWGKITPWKYETKRVFSHFDKENDEQIFKEELVWVEDTEEKGAVNATVEFITGEKQTLPNEFFNTMMLVKKENAELKEVNKSLQEKLETFMTTQEKTISEFTAKLEALQKPTVQAAEPINKTVQSTGAQNNKR